MGSSVEDSRVIGRIGEIQKVSNASVRFLSLEPLLGPQPNLPLEHIDWVIAGGESGPKSRPIQADRVRDIRDQCQARNVAFFFKQWGGVNKKKAGRMLDGHTWDEVPAQ
ncbi:MAG: DUF5131 family protein [Planctomycetes bacterium]|nr:DUF5131 family protein [Planctomycetota bacterium]NOG53106.1 DUF5131 family protein [Planctomycetota bacterium]